MELIRGRQNISSSAKPSVVSIGNFDGVHLGHLRLIEMLQKEAQLYAQVDAIQFDELQTIEHTKCKPLSVAMAVSKKDRKILSFKVSKMPATGHLAKISRKKYGKRPDERKAGMSDLFKELTGFLSPSIAISSDECSFYRGVVKRYFPRASYTQYLGKKGCVSGQGELKKTGFDPIFSINHSIPRFTV